MLFIGNFAPHRCVVSRNSAPDLPDIPLETIMASEHGFYITHPAQDLQITLTMIDEHISGAVSFNQNFRI